MSRKSRSEQPRRQWKVELTGVWEAWDRRIEWARRLGRNRLPTLDFPEPRYDAAGQCVSVWIEEPAVWACQHRGLGPYARFALARYLKLPKRQQLLLKNGQLFDANFATHVSDKRWRWLIDLAYRTKKELAEDESEKLGKAARKQEFLTKTKLNEFHSQVVREFKRGEPATPKRIERLKPIFRADLIWSLAAATANNVRTEEKRPGCLRLVDADTLQNHRFSGPHAVADFIYYLNTGAMPDRQSPFADDLSGLGVSLGRRFTRHVKFFRSAERNRLLTDLANHLAQDVAVPPSNVAAAINSLDPMVRGVIRVSSLWSPLQPHGLIAACRRLIDIYAKVCNRENRRRLPVIYVPVGLDSRRQYISRRELVTDLHRKILIARAIARGLKQIPRALPVNPTGEEIDLAIGQIRAELARSPALLVFGIHQVIQSNLRRPIEEEMRDSALPFILDRLVAETGVFGDLTVPRNAHATRVLILADGPVRRIAHLDVTDFKLPQVRSRDLGKLMEWTGCDGLRVLRAHTGGSELRAIRSNEVELSLIEFALQLGKQSGDPHLTQVLMTGMAGCLWGEHAFRVGKRRVAALVSVIVEHIAQCARLSADGAWCATLLHIVSLLPEGIRRFTVARVIATFIVATTGSTEESRAPWLRSAEHAVWLAAGEPPSGLSHKAVRGLEAEIVSRIEQFVAQATILIGTHSSATNHGFDEYPHPYESPEVPTFQFDFRRSKNHLGIRSPFVRHAFCRAFRKKFPQKHSLLCRLTAEEFTRRVAIVQRHCAERDVHSLVDKRYVIVALHQALESLEYSASSLLSAEGLLRTRREIRPLTRVEFFHWIYRWLYTQQLNSDEQALSQRHGAEFLKEALLKRFLRADPLRNWYKDRGRRFPHARISLNELRHFAITSEILHGLVHVSVRTSNADLANETLASLNKLTQRVELVFEQVREGLDEEFRQDVMLALDRAKRQTTKLGLDVAVSDIAAFSLADANHPRRWRKDLLRQALKLVAVPPPRYPPDRRPIIRMVRANSTRSPRSWRLTPAAQLIRRQVDESALQYVYDCLLRYGELLAGSAEPLRRPEARAARRIKALLVFELAEAMRVTYSSGAAATEREHVLHLSPRPVRNAARVCLSLGRRFAGQDSDAVDANWYFERAAYYSFHVTGNIPMQSVEQIALLVNEASAVRIRGGVGQLRLAMLYLKTAERALIHYPDRIQLWMRFYLERSKLFLERARSPGSVDCVDTCIHYCRSDVASVLRLAGKRDAWRARAAAVFEDLAKLEASVKEAASSDETILPGPQG